MSTSNLEKGYGAIASGTETKPTKSSWRRTLVALAAASVVVVGATAAYSARTAKTNKVTSLESPPGDCEDGGKGFGILGLDLTMNVNKWLDSDTHVPVGDYTKSCDYKDCCWQPKKNSLRCMCHPPKEDGTPVDGSDKYEAYLNTGKCTEIAFTWQVFNTNDNGKPKLDCKALNLIDDRSQWVPGM
jgi:hypothetical protein